MWISAHNRLLEATAVTIGGDYGPYALTDENKMRQHYDGDILVVSDTGGSYGDAWCAFDVPSMTLDCFAVAYAEDPVGIDTTVTLMIGGAGGSIVYSNALVFLDFERRNVVPLRHDASAQYTCDYVRFDWFDNVGGGQPRKFRRFYAGERLNLPCAIDTIGLVNEVQSTRSDFGQPSTQNLGYRRDIGLVARFADGVSAVTPLSSAIPPYPLIARAGGTHDAVIIPSDLRGACLGHFTGDPRFDLMAGPQSTLNCRVREY